MGVYFVSRNNMASLNLSYCCNESLPIKKLFDFTEISVFISLMLYYPKKMKSDGSKYKVVLFPFVSHLQGNVVFHKRNWESGLFLTW